MLVQKSISILQDEKQKLEELLDKQPEQIDQHVTEVCAELQKDIRDLSLSISILSERSGKAEYWMQRCTLAEECLNASPCDPDITERQIKAWKRYNYFKEINS